MNGFPKAIFQFAVSFLLLHAVPTANAQTNGLRFEMTGTLNLANSAPGGKILTNHQGIFRLIRHDQQWSITTKDLSLGTLEECTFDGQAVYCLLRNGMPLPNDEKADSALESATSIKDVMFSSDTPNVYISNENQPMGMGFFARTVWLGSAAGQFQSTGWKEPVILPWSTALPGSSQYFGASPEWKNGKVDSFPNKVDFRIINETGKSRMRSTIEIFPGMHALLPSGTKVGRLEVVTWTNVGKIKVPTSWLVTRLPSGETRNQEHYFVQGNIVSLDPSPITTPKPGPIASVSDSRIKLDNITIPVSYTLTNQNWLPIDDPQLITQASQRESSYLDELKLLAKASSQKQNSGTTNTPLAIK